MKTNTTSSVDRKIDSLKPGFSVEISRTEFGSVSAERSGDGKTLRFVRQIGNVSQVFKTCKF